MPANMNSSPNSVGETSARGTPSTNPTAFTPEASSSTKPSRAEPAQAAHPVLVLRLEPTRAG